MSNLTLTDARVKAFKARKAVYNIRDAKLRGFGVRVLSSGAKRFFLHIQHRGQRVWKMLGDASAMPVADARTLAASMLCAIRFGTDTRVDAPPFETVADTVFRRYAQVWKPQTLYVNRSYYRCALLPWFAGQSIADIDRQDVERWFASLRATPVSADRSMPVLSVILTEAERMGHRPEESNPCWGIRRYRRKGRERFLSDTEIRRLAGTLSAHAGERPLQVAAVRLLLLTGCRKNEILALRWAEVHADALALADSKTGPRKVPLNANARRILARQPRGESPFVFPSPRDITRPRTTNLSLWDTVRREVGIRDVRLHTLRHTVASHAVMNGVPVPVVSRLLGHANAQMTLRYAHLTDRDIEAAAERVGAGLARVMALKTTGGSPKG